VLRSACDGADDWVGSAWVWVPGGGYDEADDGGVHAGRGPIDGPIGWVGSPAPALDSSFTPL